MLLTLYKLGTLSQSSALDPALYPLWPGPRLESKSCLYSQGQGTVCLLPLWCLELQLSTRQVFEDTQGANVQVFWWSNVLRKLM